MHLVTVAECQQVIRVGEQERKPEGIKLFIVIGDVWRGTGMDVNVACLDQFDGFGQVSAGKAAVGIYVNLDPSVAFLLHQPLKLLGCQVADG